MGSQPAIASLQPFLAAGRAAAKLHSPLFKTVVLTSECFNFSFVELQIFVSKLFACPLFIFIIIHTTQCDWSVLCCVVWFAEVENGEAGCRTVAKWEEEADHRGPKEKADHPFTIFCHPSVWSLPAQRCLLCSKVVQKIDACALYPKTKNLGLIRIEVSLYPFLNSALHS